jgi:hypothetical protein
MLAAAIRPTPAAMIPQPPSPLMSASSGPSTARG